ncbi:hypothetical protein EVAR_97535_1 [Eumeta japonica]|uniref:Uncharacterized protein n=1 Tax=Eumeta variegata TaxID=151549 RepID=A0A4C1WPL1_EUMVA|nr:hypothetical protein EVAR_97535_1 [Eumeta japonica]
MQWKQKYLNIQENIPAAIQSVQLDCDGIRRVRKLCTPWIPYNLTEAQKSYRVTEAAFALTIPKSKDSAQWVLPFEKWPTKIKREKAADNDINDVDEDDYSNGQHHD